MITPIANKKSSLSQIIKNEPELVSFPREGDLIEAKLLNKTPKTAYFDLGKFGTGVICGIEFLNAKNILKNIETEQTVSAKIVLIDNEEGFTELSLADARQQKEWQSLKEKAEGGEVLTVKISGANSGGLISEINGVKAFLPVSQLSNDHYPRVENQDRKEIINELRKLVDQELKVKIIDLNPRANKLIISERETTQEDVKKLIANYKVGDIIDGIVSGTTSFGVFIRFADQPSVEGLIHISEMDYKIIDSPKEIVKINEAIKSKIIEIKNGQIFLSFKALKPDPWETAGEKFKEGMEISGTAYKFNPAGALINLDYGLQGIVGVSEFGGFEEMKKQLETGKQYQFTVESVKPEEKRIILKRPAA